MALFNHFLKFRQQSMRSFSCMANHAGKAGARGLRPKPQNPCTRITQRLPESLGFQGFLRYSVRIIYSRIVPISVTEATVVFNYNTISANRNHSSNIGTEYRPYNAFSNRIDFILKGALPESGMLPIRFSQGILFSFDILERYCRPYLFGILLFYIFILL